MQKQDQKGKDGKKASSLPWQEVKRPDVGSAAKRAEKAAKAAEEQAKKPKPESIVEAFCRCWG